MTSTKKAAEQLRDFNFLPSRADTTETVESWFPEVVSLACLLPYTGRYYYLCGYSVFHALFQ